MTDLIPRDAAIAAITIGHTVTQHEKALRAIPTIDPASIREAALREAVKRLRDWQDNLSGQRYPDTSLTVGIAADVIETMIGEKK